jgi:hypothetical protein
METERTTFKEFLRSNKHQTEQKRVEEITEKKSRKKNWQVDDWKK